MVMQVAAIIYCFIQAWLGTLAVAACLPMVRSEGILATQSSVPGVGDPGTPIASASGFEYLRRVALLVLVSTVYPIASGSQFHKFQVSVSMDMTRRLQNGARQEAYAFVVQSKAAGPERRKC
ncbi:hypothetical protein GGI35DRAFT_438679 [Trichoderma velutinum]